MVWLGGMAKFADAADGTLNLNGGLAVLETYTDNLFFDPANEKDDFGTFVTPFISLQYASKDVVFRGVYGGTLQFFVNNSNANTYLQNADFFIDLPFLNKRYKGLQVQLVETFNFSPQLQGFAFTGEPGDQNRLFTDPSSGATQGGAVNNINFGGVSNPSAAAGVGNQGVFTRRTTNDFQNLAGFNLRYALTPAWSPFVQYRNRITLFNDDDFNDFTTNEVRTGVSYRWSPLTTLNSSYNGRHVSITGGDSFFSHAVFVGMTQQLTPTLFYLSSVGASITDENINFNTVSSLRLVIPKGSVVVTFSQQIQPGGGLALTAARNRVMELSITRSLSRRIGGFVNGGYAQNNSLSGDELAINTYTAQAGISIVLLRWLAANLRYSYVNQDSSGTAGNSAQANRAFIGLTASIPEWRILQ